MRTCAWFLMAIVVVSFSASCGGSGGTMASVTPPTSSGTPRLPIGTPAPDQMTVFISDIEKDPGLFEGELARVRGYGVTMATLPLCEGYIGQDKRVLFIDARNDSIVAVVQTSSLGVYHREADLRVFEGYVRVFEGRVGCPGETKTEKFPYFEIVGVE